MNANTLLLNANTLNANSNSNAQSSQHNRQGLMGRGRRIVDMVVSLTLASVVGVTLSLALPAHQASAQALVRVFTHNTTDNNTAGGRVKEGDSGYAFFHRPADNRTDALLVNLTVSQNDGFVGASLLASNPAVCVEGNTDAATTSFTGIATNNPANATVTFPAGCSAVRVGFDFADDSTDLPPLARFFITIENGENYTTSFLNGKFAGFAMADNDPVMSIASAQRTQSVNEGEAIAVTVESSSATAATHNHNVTIRVIADPANQVGGVGANYTVDFPAGATSATHTITTTNNTADTNNNTVILEIVDYATDFVILGNGGYSKHATEANRRITATLVDGTPPPKVMRVFIGNRDTTLTTQDIPETNPDNGQSGRILFHIRTADNSTFASDTTINLRVRQPEGVVWVDRPDNGGFLDGASGISGTGVTAGTFAVPDLITASSSDGSITIPAGQSGFIMGILVGNNKDNNNPNTVDNTNPRRMIFDLLAGTGYTISSTHGTATANVYDDDPAITLAAGNQYVLQGENLRVTATGSTSEDHSIEFTVTDTAGVTGSATTRTMTWAGSAASGTLDVATGMGTIGAGGNASVTLATADNTTNGYRLDSGSPTSLQYYVYSAPTLSVGDVSVTEGQSATVTFTSSHRYPRDLSIAWSTADGTAGSADYTAQTAGTATIAANSTSATATIATSTDSVSELLETFTVEATATIPLASGTTTSTDSGTVSIVDDTADPVVTISANVTEVRAGETYNLTVNNVGNISSTELTVNVTITGGIDEIGNTAYVLGTVIPFRIPANEREASFLVKAQGRGGDSSDIVATISTSTAMAYTIAPAPLNAATVSILTTAVDFVDGSGTAITKASVEEGNSITLNVTLDPVQSSATSISYATVDGGAFTDADAGVHYTGMSGTLEFPANTAQQTITIPTTENNVFVGEFPPSFNVTLSGVADGTLVENNIVVTIGDNDDAPQLSLAGPGRIAPGRNGTFTIRAADSVATATTTIKIEVDGNASLVYTTDAVTGMPNSPVVANQNGTQANVPLPAGNSSVQFVVQADDGPEEALSPIVVTLITGNAAAGTFGSYRIDTAANAVTSLVEPVGVAFTDGSGADVTAVTIDEGEGVVLNVTLMPPQATDVEINYTTADATSQAGVAGQHYRATSGVLRFPAGETQATIRVDSLQDNVYQRTLNRRFLVTLAGMVDGGPVDAMVEITIADDEAMPALALAGPSRITPGENGSFSVRSLTSVTTGILTVRLEVDGNASLVYTDPDNDPTNDVIVAGNATPFNVVIPIGQRSARFVVTADAGEEAELDPIVVRLASAGFTGYTIGTAQQGGAGNATAELRPLGLDPKALNEAILPQAVVSVLDEVGGAIASRTHRSFGDTESATTRRGAGFAGSDGSSDAGSGYLTIGGESLLSLAGREATREAAENPWDAVDSAGRQSLLESLDAYDLAFSLPLQAGEGRGGVSVWGQGFVRNVEGAAGAVGFDGEVPGAVLGVDARVSDNLLAGIGFASSTADFEYAVADDTEVLRGSHETELTLYSPYVGYRTEGGANVWAMLGVGEGEVTVRQRGDAAGDVYVGELEVLSYGAGFNSLSEAQRDAVGGESVAWNWHGDVQWAMVEETPTARTRAAGAFGGSAAGAEVSVGRARLGAEISQVQDLDGGGLLRRSIDLAVRHDSGDTAEGGAVEIGGSLGLDLVSGIKLDLTARTLLFHEESVEDWGVSGGFNWVSQPGAGGRGLTLALSPEWGNSDVVAAGAGAGSGGLLADGFGVADGVTPAGVGAGEARYGFDVRYGIPVLRDGLLVPYVSGDAGDVGESAVYGGAYSLGGFAAGVEAGDADAGNAFIRYERDF